MILKLKLLEDAHREALEILIENRAVLDKLVLQLLEKETLVEKELNEIFKDVIKRDKREVWRGIEADYGVYKEPVSLPKELTDSVKVSEDNSVAYGFKILDSESKDKENNSCDNTSEVTEKDNETNKQSIECGNVDNNCHNANSFNADVKADNDCTENNCAEDDSSQVKNPYKLKSDKDDDKTRS